MSENQLDNYLGPLGGELSWAPRHPAKGDLPNERRTIEFDRFELRGRSVGVADAWQAPHGVSVGSGAGVYILEADCVAYGADRRVARVRAVLQGARVGTRAELGEIAVDVGMACIYDAEVFGDFAKGKPEAYAAWVEEYVVMCDWRRSGFISCEPARTRLVYFDAGFGDGTYKVFALNDERTAVGLEVVFVDGDVPYQFDPPEHLGSGRERAYALRWAALEEHLGTPVTVRRIGVDLPLGTQCVFCGREIPKGKCASGRNASACDDCLDAGLAILLEGKEWPAQ